MTNPKNDNIFVPIRKHLKRLIIDESNKEKNIMRQSYVMDLAKSEKHTNNLEIF